MSIELNQEGFNYAKSLIEEGRVVNDLHGDWDEVNPGTREQDQFIHERGMEAFGRWHLGFKVGGSREDKTSYSFPYGNYEDLYRSGVIAAEERAAQFHHGQVLEAAKALEEMLGNVE